ncbi:transcriptional regulator family: Fungal Specific TF [Aspergillus niger]|nr:transcriptional regulator family: Fungal Specific TF [Aspergillus niger]
MPPRNKGLKSRYGCSACKKRRVKCDEVKPVCGNCAKFHHGCSYISITPRAVGDRQAIGSNSPAELQHRTQPAYTTDDLYLLHIFTTETALSLSDDPEVKKSWQTHAVHLALEHSFLLEGMLSLSALHVASKNIPCARHYSIIAANKTTAALRYFRAELQHIGPENCEALFVFSLLITFYVPASAGTAINPGANFLKNDPLDSVIEWLRLYRSAHDLYNQFTDLIHAGSISTLVPGHFFRESTEGTLNVLEREHLAEMCLSNLLNKARLEQSQALLSSLEKEMRKTNSATFLSLLHALAKYRPSPAFLNPTILKLFAGDIPVLSPDLESRLEKAVDFSVLGGTCWLSSSFVWLFNVSSEYLDALQRCQDVSLIILAYFAFILYRSPRQWWNSHIATHISRAVSSRLPQGCQLWISSTLNTLSGR